ncbi:unnamed protein product [Larinioides sclopetarius]|uniref:Uncharacterized protein n=2 Tax=Larinioides sclopetarius TaxID=280406 RepID=A0AAV2A6F7_9ARAC
MKRTEGTGNVFLPEKTSLVGLRINFMMLVPIPGLVLLLYLSQEATAADGQWGEWSDWVPCSVSCGRGMRRRFRACNPVPGVGSRWCQGKHVQTEDCDTTVPCPVNGGWSEWSNWSLCSATCGQGTTNRYRSCSNPIAMNGGRPCEGSPQESDMCFAVKECPRDGGWSKWSSWSLCSVTCGPGGTINRYRSCNNPPPMAEGKPCQGPTQQTRLCKASRQCPVNGQWSEWTEWSECSVSCGRGERIRRRACDQPIPQHGGLECDETEAGELQIISCTAEILNCPVDGGWSEWSGYGPCHSPDCSGPDSSSISMRQRSCNSPLPKYNGSMCQGVFIEAGLCHQPINCVVNGGWSEWSSWRCGRFVASRTRVCDSPPPSKGGKKCPGKDVQMHVKMDEVEEYRKACGNFPSDDEDLEDGSGIRQGSGDGFADDG